MSFGVTMQNGNLNKIKVSALVFSRIERAVVDLLELIQAGEGGPRARPALLSLQATLNHLEMEKTFPSPTWEGPQPPEAA